MGQEAQSIGALAFTHGTDLYFAPGQYNPQSSQGQQLLGHELTHVLQQRAGQVRNPLGSGVAVVQDPALEAEAERMGQGAASAPSPIQAKPAEARLACAISAVSRTKPNAAAANGAILPARSQAQGSVQAKPGRPILPAQPTAPAVSLLHAIPFSGVIQRTGTQFAFQVVHDGDELDRITTEIKNKIIEIREQQRIAKQQLESDLRVEFAGVAVKVSVYGSEDQKKKEAEKLRKTAIRQYSENLIKVGMSINLLRNDAGFTSLLKKKGCSLAQDTTKSNTWCIMYSAPKPAKPKVGPNFKEQLRPGRNSSSPRSN